MSSVFPKMEAASVSVKRGGSTWQKDPERGCCASCWATRARLSSPVVLNGFLISFSYWSRSWNYLFCGGSLKVWLFLELIQVSQRRFNWEFARLHLLRWRFLRAVGLYGFEQLNLQQNTYRISKASTRHQNCSNSGWAACGLTQVLAPQPDPLVLGEFLP